MESSAHRWEAAFSLSDSSRERVLLNSRSRHRPTSMEKNRLTLSARSTSILGRETATHECKSPNFLNSSQIVDDDKDTVNGPDVTDPVTHTNKPKKARSPRKTLLMKAVNGDHKAMPTSTCKLIKELHKRSPHFPRPCSKSDLDVGADAKNAPSSAQARVSLSTHTSRKRSKMQMEITYSEFEYEKLPARLEADFFQCDALELAPKLLGKFLRRDDVVLQITEVEAYRPNDSACHGRFGVTARTAAMFGSGGHAYVYLCYGLHVMLNIVADIEGVGAAVLIRSCAPIAGLQTIQSRRGITSSKPILLTGPGKIGQALGLTTEWSSHPLYVAGGLELLDGPTTENILVGPRVGINYANPADVTALWRFAIAGTPWISAPTSNLAPPHYSL